MDSKINNKILSVALLVLLIASAMTMISLTATNTVAADNSIPTTPYGDPMQEKYAYPIGPGGNSGNNFYNPGPAPNTPSIKWTTTTANLGYTGTLAATPPVAFDGKLFVYSAAVSSSGTPARLWALDPQTGGLIWVNNITSTPRGFGTATMFQVDATHIGWETSNGIEIHSTLDGSTTGRLVVNNTDNGFTSLGGGSVVYWGGFYSSWDKLKYSTAAAQPGYYPGITTVVHVAVAIDCSNPANPYVKWTWKAPTGIEALGSGPGIAIFGGYGEGEIYVLNATTGKLLWSASKDGNCGYAANYYEGCIYQSASSTALTCWNATTGELIFNHDEGGRAFFVFGDALAYGRYYGKNIALPNSYVGCWDAYTGEPLWKTPALYNIAYLIPIVADGKVFVMRYSGTAGGEVSQGNSFACFDAFTGDVLWELPGTNWAEPMIAYGNLYAVSGGTVYCMGESDQAFSEFHEGNVNSPGVIQLRTGPADITSPLWKFGDAGAITGSAVAANGKVYFGALDQNIYCLNANTGEKIWSFKTGYRVASTPAVEGNLLITGSDDGNVYGLDATSGTKLWQTPVGGKTEVFWISAWQLRSSPVIDNGVAYVGSLDGKVYAISTSNGAVKWSSYAGNETYPIGGTPLVTSDTVYVASGDSFLYSFNKATGALNWKVQVQPTSGFDIRAQTSTPVLDRGTLWLATDTHTMSRYNASTGYLMTQLYLNYSRGGTMTPAICTPAIANISGRTVMYVGDGFQLDCYDITTFSYNSSFFLSTDHRIGTFTGVVAIQQNVFFRYPNGTEIYISGSNYPDIRNNVNIDINQTASNLRGNETLCPLIWTRWLGHQVYSSPIVVTDLRGTKVYFGDDVYSISVINGSIWTGPINIPGSVEAKDLRGGNSLSVYTTKGQVFSSACIYDGKLYMGSQDGYLYCFGDRAPTAAFTLNVASSKGQEMWNNETIDFEGRLQPTVKLYNDPQGDPTNLGIYDSASLPNATIILSLSKPDGSSQNLTTTTDNQGFFSFAVSPTAVGDWGWVVFYEGENKAWITYEPVYTDFNPVSVIAAPGTEATPTPTETPIVTEAPTEAPTMTPEATTTTTPAATETSGSGMPVEYIYAIVAVVVIVIIAVAAYMVTKRKK